MDAWYEGVPEHHPWLYPARLPREERVDLERLKHGLIVSCQAHGDHPLRDTAIIAALAECCAWLTSAT